MFSAACFIPARGGSKRIPGKNTKILGGKPLVAWSIEAALNAMVFDGGVWVTSDDDQILGLAREFGARTIKRPPELAGDDVNAHLPFVHAVAEATKIQGGTFEAVCFHQPTSPFVSAATYQRMFQARMMSQATVVCGALEVPHKGYMICLRNEDGIMEPAIARTTELLRDTPMEPVYHARVCPYWCFYDTAIDSIPLTKHADTVGHDLSIIEGFDIDTLDEWDVAEILSMAVGEE